MLLGQDAVGQRVLVVARLKRHRALQYDRPVVQVLIDEVHGAAADLHAVVEGLPLRVHAGEGRQQRRMDVEDPRGELLDEPRRQQAHVAGQADQIDLRLS